MTNELHRRSTCRLCDSGNVEKVVDLAPIPLSEAYSTDRSEALAAKRYPIDLYMCSNCCHVQHLDVINPSMLWDSYTYYSGDAKGIPEHFEQVAAKIIGQARPPKGSLVIDIGGNDGSLLKPFKRAGYRVLNIDPATEVAKRANADGIPTIPALMSSGLARRIRAEQGPADVICAFNVFAHADDLGDMAEAVREMLAPEGLFYFEAQYLLDIIDGMLIATIFHEHMSHHSVRPLVGFLDRHLLQLLAVERTPIQHGSLIGTVQLKGGKRPVEDSVHQLLAVEDERRLDRVETLKAFGARVSELRRKTADLMARLRANGHSIAGYGAARSGPTLIAQLGLAGTIDFIVDDHPQKVGKYETGDGLAVVPTAELLRLMPDYTVILAWVHSKRIIETNQDYLDRGGQFIVLCPQTCIVGRRGNVNI